MIASIEYSAGFGVSYVASQREADAVATVEKQLAVTECTRLAVELSQTDPVKAATLDAASKDSTKTAYELYGLIKTDGRTGTKPPGETDTKPASSGTK